MKEYLYNELLEHCGGNAKELNDLLVWMLKQNEQEQVEYMFDELSTDVQEEVFERTKQNLIDTQLSFMYETLMDEINANGLNKNITLKYNIGFAQGDYVRIGAMDVVRLMNLENETNLNIFEQGLLEVLTEDELKVLIGYLKLVDDNSININDWDVGNRVEIYGIDYWWEHQEVLNKVEKEIENILYDFETDLRELGYDQFYIDDSCVSEELEGMTFDIYGDEIRG